jgi:hypothetical protein
MNLGCTLLSDLCQVVKERSEESGSGMLCTPIPLLLVRLSLAFQSLYQEKDKFSLYGTLHSYQDAVNKFESLTACIICSTDTLD